MDFEESTGSSDKEVVLEESGGEGKTSEDEIFEESKSDDSSSDDNEKAQSKGSKAGNQTTNGDSQKSSSSAGARGNNLDAAGGSRQFINSGPDSVDANAAERIKSTTLRRQRKQVERFVIAPPTTSRDKSIVIPEGAGTKLQDIPYVAEQINVSHLYTIDLLLISTLTAEVKDPTIV